MKGGAEQEWDRMWPEKDHPLKEGDSIQGIKMGVVTKYGSNNSNVWLLEVNGETVGVWGSTVIDEHMKNIPDGAEVGIEYGGMADSAKRRKAHRTLSNIHGAGVRPALAINHNTTWIHTQGLLHLSEARPLSVPAPRRRARSTASSAR